MEVEGRITISIFAIDIQYLQFCDNKHRIGELKFARSISIFLELLHKIYVIFPAIEKLKFFIFQS